MPSITAIVPATDAAPTLPCCLAALEAGKDRPDELIVQREPRSASPARARNLAAETARCDVLVFVDADVVAHPDAISRIRQRMARDPGLAAVFGAYDDLPEDPGLVSRFRNLFHHQVHIAGTGRATTFWAGLGAIRRKELLAVGGFDADRFPAPSVEDVELGMRLHAAGSAIELDPAIRGKHLKRWTLRSVVATDFSRRAVPWARLLIERRSASTALNLGMRHRVSAVASLLAVAAAAARKPLAAASFLAGLIALNASFYALLVRRGGLRLALAGLALHVLHHLVSLAALPVAAAIEARRYLPWPARAAESGRS